MALLAPAFEIKLYVPLAKESIIFLTKLNKNAKIPSYVKSRVLTHDENEQKKYDSDRLITKDINARLLVDLLDAGKRLADDSAAIEIPTIIFSAGKDYVAEIYTDGDKSIPTRTKVRVSKFRVNAKTVLHFNLRASGGSPFV